MLSFHLSTARKSDIVAHAVHINAINSLKRNVGPHKHCIYALTRYQRCTGKVSVVYTYLARKCCCHEWITVKHSFVNYNIAIGVCIMALYIVQYFTITAVI